MESKKKQLNELIRFNNIPNLLFHGPYLEGKEELCKYFINTLYPNQEEYQKYVLWINCLYDNGIQSMKQHIKLFAMQIIKQNQSISFKVVVLQYAEYLTHDAQYCLRRTIEQYNKNTRFIVLCENKHKLLQPICSRFVQMYINLNLHKKNFQVDSSFRYPKFKQLMKQYETCEFKDLYQLACLFYKEHFLAIELLQKFKSHPRYNEVYFLFNSFRKETKNETLSIFYLLNVFRNKSHIQIFSI